MHAKVEYIESIFPPSPYLNIFFIGQSGVGKSYYAHELIKSLPIIYPKYTVRKLNIISPLFSHQYSTITQQYPNFEHFTSLSEENLDKMIDLPSENSISILYFDDLSYSLFDNPMMERLLTTQTRHSKLMVIVTLQALYQKNSSAFRTCIRQCHLLFLGNSFRERNSIATLFTQLYGKGSSLLCSHVLDACIKTQRERYKNQFYFLLIRLDPFCDPDKRLIYDCLSTIPLIFKPNGCV